MIRPASLTAPALAVAGSVAATLLVGRMGLAGTALGAALMSATIWLVNEMGRPPLERASRRMRRAAPAPAPAAPAPRASVRPRWRRLAAGAVVVAALATSAVSAHQLTVGGEPERTVVVTRVERVVRDAPAAPAQRVITVVREAPAPAPAAGAPRGPEAEAPAGASAGAPAEAPPAPPARTATPAPPEGEPPTRAGAVPASPAPAPAAPAPSPEPPGAAAHRAA